MNKSSQKPFHPNGGGTLKKPNICRSRSSLPIERARKDLILSESNKAIGKRNYLPIIFHWQPWNKPSHLKRHSRCLHLFLESPKYNQRNDRLVQQLQGGFLPRAVPKRWFLVINRMPLASTEYGRTFSMCFLPSSIPNERVVVGTENEKKRK